jgi:glycyl-tRNA synthetase beta chain
MHKELLFEIGTEEIPSEYLPAALTDLAATAKRLLAEERLAFDAVRTLATPRRLVLVAEGLAEAQEDRVRQVVGPTKAVAYDAQGNPTRAAQGFARAQGVPVEQLQVRALERGEYVVAVVEERGVKAVDLLPGLLVRLLGQLSFPKFMRWGNGTVRFVRPIRWMLALYGGRLLEFTVDGVPSGNKTYGHRFLSPRSARVHGFAEYLETLERKHVIVDQDRRRDLVKQLAAEAAATVGGAPLLDPDLVETVTHLVELPTVVCGSFKPEFLGLPREVVITPMRKHQRYFPVVDAKGNLLPHFVAISNMRAKDMDLIREGNERVLRARLTDAEFFYREDRKVPLADRVPALQGVVFQERLGTVLDKVDRVEALAAHLAEAAGPDPAPAAKARRAARLCKADLATTMVKEFPELQGIMGAEYARLSGEDAEVARAIEEHYRPRFAGDAVAGSTLGAIVALADKLDTLAGCFGIGVTPTGAGDPFALRRAALGVVVTLLDRKLAIPLAPAVRRALALLGPRCTRPTADVEGEVMEFLRGRLHTVLQERGIAADLADAALAAGIDNVPDAARRAEALMGLRKEPDFAELAVTFRRVVNILPPGFSRPVNPQQFVESAERALHGQTEGLRAEVTPMLAAGEYLRALRHIAALRPVVDMFFDEVLVMAEDANLRENRLALLAEVAQLFARIADFTRIAVTG